MCAARTGKGPVGRSVVCECAGGTNRPRPAPGAPGRGKFLISKVEQGA